MRGSACFVGAHCMRPFSQILIHEGLLVTNSISERAAGGNRTRNSDMAGQCFTTKLRPQQSRQKDLNLQPAAYEAVALPLSYTGVSPQSELN